MIINEGSVSMAKSLICLFRERKYRCNQYIVQNFQTVIFFILVFYFLLFGFGPQYLIFVSIFTVMFKLNYKKKLHFLGFSEFLQLSIFPKRRSLYCYLKYLPDHRIESTGTFLLNLYKIIAIQPQRLLYQFNDFYLLPISPN